MLAVTAIALLATHASDSELRFRPDGSFTIAQIADLHVTTDDAAQPCADLSESERRFGCSWRNSTDFVRRVIAQEQPDLIVFTGDNILEGTSDIVGSLRAAFAPAIEARTPWLATLGNHDCSRMSRRAMMHVIAHMPYSRARVGPAHVHNGAGTYVVDIAPSSAAAERALSTNATDEPLAPSTDQPRLSFPNLALYMLDSGALLRDAGSSPIYEWISMQQQAWFMKEARNRQQRRRQLGAGTNNVLVGPSLGLAFFHIPLPEYAALLASGTPISGSHNEPVSAPPFNSGFHALAARTQAVRAMFVGHDHLNDLCGTYGGLELCYAGAAGYHAYGRPGWARRARIIRVYQGCGTSYPGGMADATTHKWLQGARIESWKVLATPTATDWLERIDRELLWAESPSEEEQSARATLRRQP